jgi:predicted nuclease with TOPRIM domain
VADDIRGAAEVQKDSAQLRQRLTRLESDYSGWQAAVDKREAEKRDLKRQRDQLKKDRDHWKDLAKKDD